MAIGTSGLSGVFSGIDTDVIVSRLMQINSIPLNRLQSRKREWTAKETALADIKLSLTHIQGLVEQMRDEDNLRGTLASSSDTAVLTATSEAGAAEGSYEIIINQLAKADRKIHTAGMDALTDLVGTGNFVYTYRDGVEEAAVQRTIVTEADTTLEGLRDLINNDSANPGVTASIIEYSDKYYLVLNGNNTGVHNTITIDNPATTLVGFQNGDFSVMQAAQEAKIKVDGYPPATDMEFSTNSITNAIPGVTLNLVSTTPGETVTVNRSTADLKTDLGNLVAMYNGLAISIDKYAGYDEDNETGGIFQGDAMITGILARIRALLVYRAGGFVDGQETYTLPSDIGVEIGSEGLMDSEGNLISSGRSTLALDEDTLADAIDADYDAVLELIGAAGKGASNDENGYIDFYNAGTATEAGVYNVEVDWDGAAITAARVRRPGESTWRTDVTIAGNIITFTDNSELGLQLVIDLAGQPAGSGPTAYTADIRVKQGFAGELDQLLDDMLDVIDGSIASKEDQISDAIDLIDKNIETQQIRLAAKEEVLLAKYARMEMLLAQLDAQRGAVEAMLSSLAAINNQNQK